MSTKCGSTDCTPGNFCHLSKNDFDFIFLKYGKISFLFSGQPGNFRRSFNLLIQCLNHSSQKFLRLPLHRSRNLCFYSEGFRSKSALYSEHTGKKAASPNFQTFSLNFWKNRSSFCRIWDWSKVIFNKFDSWQNFATDKFTVQSRKSRLFWTLPNFVNWKCARSFVGKFFIYQRANFSLDRWRSPKSDGRFFLLRKRKPKSQFPHHPRARGWNR